MIAKTWQSVRAWFSGARDWMVGLFGDNADDVRTVLVAASGLIDKALPIVESLDAGLKQDLAADPLNRTAVMNAVTELGVTGSDRPLTEAAKIANRVAGLSVSEVLAAVAVYVLGRQVPAGIPERILRLAIELAYCVYKARRG